MTVFGRDTLITSSPDAALRARAARSALRCAGAAAGGRTTTRRSTPSRGRSARGAARQGGGALVPRLLRLGRRDAALPRPALGGAGAGRTTSASRASSASPAMRALEWIDEWGDRDGDGFVEYERRTPRGLATSRGRTPATRSASPTARIARGPIAPVRGAGLRLRREAPDGRARARGRGATGELAERLDAEADALHGALQRGVLDRRARRLLRARARRRQAAGRLALLEHRSPALERDRPARSASTRRGRARRRRALVRLGRPDDVGRRRRVQPAQLPQRHGLAARQLPDRAGLVARTGRWPEAHRIVRRMLEAAELLRLPAARGLRRPAALGDAVPDRRTRPPRARRRGRRARRCCCSSCCSGSGRTRAGTRSRACAAGAAVVGRRRPARRRPRLRPPLGRGYDGEVGQVEIAPA